jgi:hypothetical protein
MSHSKKSYLSAVKLTLLICISLLLFSCSSESSKNAADSIAAADSAPVPFEIPTTALPVKPTALPPGFKLDTFSFNDTAKHFHALFHYPLTSDINFNYAVTNFLHDYTLGYEDYHPGEFETASVEVWITSFAVTGKLISMCFTDQSFATGAAHYNHGYTSLNFDTLQRKGIFLTDIFKIDTEKQKQKFCDSILSPGINTDLRIEPADIHKNTDFVIEKGNLIFFFDDFEKGPSMTTDTVSLKSLRTFLKADYRYLAD